MPSPCEPTPLTARATRRRAGDAITYYDAPEREREVGERGRGEREKEERRRAGDAITSRRRGASSCSRQLSIAHWLNACVHGGMGHDGRMSWRGKNGRPGCVHSSSLEGYLLRVFHDGG